MPKASSILFFASTSLTTVRGKSLLAVVFVFALFAFVPLAVLVALVVFALFEIDILLNL